MSFRHFTRFCLITLAAVAFGGGCRVEAQLNAQEQQIANYLMTNPGQQRPFVQIDPILSRVARARAMDMAKRNYFAHVNPDGFGANYLVRQAGYTLPSNYDPSPSANNIESIAAGDTTAAAAWTAWMGSPPHKTHLLALQPFYAAQTSVGVGYYYDANATYQYYWVVITAPPPGPALAISTPTANAGLTASQTGISGTTGGDPAAASVVWRLENSAGTTDFQTASGTTNWSATVTDLVPGPNTVRVQSLDSSGTVLKEVTRAFRYVVLSPLVVSIEGSGTVTTGFVGTTQRELGERYSITAKAATGWLFDHWSGSLDSSAATASFIMQDGYTLTANFRVNPFYQLKGAYNGLVQSSPATSDTSGFLKVTTTTTGAFSGKLLLGGKTYTLAGKFDDNGNAQLTIKRGTLAPLTVSLSLDLTGGTDRITGSITDGNFVASISADEASPTTQKHFAAGRYTLALAPNPDDTSSQIPQGSGYAVVTVSNAGVATLAGVLADGRAVSATATVSRDGLFPIYALFPAGAGSFAGSATFDAQTGALDGNALWTKTPHATDRYYPAGFSTQPSIAGSRYVAPAAGVPALAVPQAQDNSTLQLDDGDLQSAVTQSTTLLPNNKIMVVDSQLSKLALSITPSTGRFTGSFIHPVTQVLTHISGVVLQSRNAVSGFFLGQNGSGAATFSPAQ